MARIIRGGEVVEDPWILVEESPPDPVAVPRPAMLPLSAWLSLPPEVRGQGDTAPWLASGEEFEEAVDALLQAPLIALHFPVFRDGRHFSTAFLLRKRYGYRGELRAVGHVIRDQLFYLTRCGFDSVQLREGMDPEAALASLADFSLVYQPAADDRAPLLRRRG